MGTVVGSWRLNAMIVLFVLLTSIYVSYVFLGDINNTSSGEYVVYEDDVETVNFNDTMSGLEKSNDFLGVFGTLANMITFGNIDNFYARLFLNMVMSVVWISIGYIVYTYIKEWIPLT